MMKFRDPKTGKVFENIRSALSNFLCPGPCNLDCPLHSNAFDYGPSTNHPICMTYVLDHPVKAARLMGYEVVEENELIRNTGFHASTDTRKEDKPMEQVKPLKDWTLGEVKAYCAAKDGNCLNDCKLTHKGITGKVCRLVTLRPAGWDLSDSPRFTPEEVERAKAIKIAFPGASAITKVVDGSWAILHYNAPPTDGFPSVRPGRTVKLSEIIGGRADE